MVSQSYDELARREVHVFVRDGRPVLGEPWPRWLTWSLWGLLDLPAPSPGSPAPTLVWYRRAGLVVINVGAEHATYRVVENVPEECALLTRLVEHWTEGAR